MTQAEIGELGRQCLVEYEKRLSVNGIREHDPGHTEEVKFRVPGDFRRVTPQTLRQGIDQVLENLAEKGGLIMSEPREWVPPPKLRPEQTVTACHNNLRITFFEIITADANIWIFCWYYLR
jgi:hypothetical protein